MNNRVLAVVAIFLLASTVHATIINVTPEGDGQNGKERWGYTDSYYWAGYDSSPNPNWAGHWYEYGSGQYRDVYMQVSLAGVSNVTSASLNFFVLECTGSGGQIYHKTDASSATGLASQEIGGDVKIQDITGASGWYSIDVTSYIQADVAAGYNWAVFSFLHKSYSSLKFSSGNDATNVPYLSVVPEPATLALLGLGGLLLKRKR